MSRYFRTSVAQTSITMLFYIYNVHNARMSVICWTQSHRADKGVRSTPKWLGQRHYNTLMSGKFGKQSKKVVSVGKHTKRNVGYITN